MLVHRTERHSFQSSRNRQDLPLVVQRAALRKPRSKPRRLPLMSAADITQLEDHLARLEELSRDEACHFATVFSVSKEEAFCTVPEDLQAKYSVPPNGSQTIFEVRNKMSLETMVYNSERGRKPQTFKEDFSADTLIEAANYLDSSRGDMNRCDFCRYSSLTAEDSFGRVEYGSVVSASNLFKLGLHHGLLLFREHHPLKLDPVSIRDGIAASLLWFQAANKTDPLAVYPLLLWNTLPRAGASQFHGHMQTFLARRKFPHTLMEENAAARFAAQGLSYWDAIKQAHHECGLAYSLGEDASVGASPAPADRLDASVYVCLTSNDIVIEVEQSRCALLAHLIHSAIKALQVCADCGSFNVGIHFSSLDQDDSDQVRAIARIRSRGKLDSRASDFGALELFGNMNVAKTDPWELVECIKRIERDSGLVRQL